MCLFRLLLLGLCLTAALGAQAQRVPDVATAESRLEASQLKAAELKAVADAAHTALDETKAQLKVEEKTLKELQKKAAKQEGELRVATTKQKAAEMDAKQSQVAVKEAKKREKAAAKKNK